MEKLKAMQPVIIVILICLSVFQFVQIGNMKNEMDAMQSEIYRLENKLDKQSSSSIWSDIDVLEKRISTLEGTVEEQQDKIDAVKDFVVVRRSLFR